MMNDSETLRQLIIDIESSNPTAIELRPNLEAFQLCNNSAITSNLSGNTGAFIIRTLLHKMGIDEHSVLKWRMEHKYRQYHVFNYFLPGCMPETFSLTQILNEENGYAKARALCDADYFVKAALGDSSGRGHNFDKTSELEQIIIDHRKAIDQEEKWILQRRLNLLKEFRVHSFDKDVLYGLTMLMTDIDASYVTYIDETIKILLERLPSSLLQGTLIGWDIAITAEYDVYVIEANITGFHLEYQAGFQTSGYFGDFYYGSMMCAWLNNYFRLKYNITIDTVDELLQSSSDFYKEFMFYNSLFTEVQWSYLNQSRSGADQASAIIYIGDDINCLVTKLLDFFQLGSFAKTYYLIVHPESFFSLSSLFCRNKLVKVIGEHELFIQDDLKIIKQLSYELREKECCDRLFSIYSQERCFIVR